MTFTKTPPTVPGFYAWRFFEHSEPTCIEVGHDENGDLYAIISCRLVNNMGGEWCRLLPAEEVEKSFTEGVEKGWHCSEHTSVGELYHRSRAKQIAEGTL